MTRLPFKGRHTLQAGCLLLLAACSTGPGSGVAGYTSYCPCQLQRWPTTWAQPPAYVPAPMPAPEPPSGNSYIIPEARAETLPGFQPTALSCPST